MLTVIQQWLCGLRGHCSVLHFEDSRVSMRCTSCGHNSAGWKTGIQGTTT